MRPPGRGALAQRDRDLLQEVQRILHAEQGDGGFGYDPLFSADGYELSNAELSPEQKDAISHRGQALRALAPHIVTALGG